MTWGFIWLMLALKIPLAALIYLVWWAIKQEPEEAQASRRRRRRQAPPPAPAASRSRAVRAGARTAIRRRCRPHACGRSGPARGRSGTEPGCKSAPAGRLARDERRTGLGPLRRHDPASWSRRAGSGSIRGTPSSSSRPASICASATPSGCSTTTARRRSTCASRPRDLTEEVVIGAEESFVIHPGEFCLGRTLEWVELPDDIVARIEGKSSIGRLGLIVHATAGFCDPGWKGTLTLELNNLTRIPIKLYPGLLIAQLSFMSLDRAGRSGPTAAPSSAATTRASAPRPRAATRAAGPARRTPSRDRIGSRRAVADPRRRGALEGAVLHRRRPAGACTPWCSPRSG